METEKEKTSYGEFKIADEAIEVIVDLAIKSVKGVVDLHRNPFSNIIHRLGIKSNTGGIKISVNNNEVTIEARIIVEFGYNIPEAAYAVQQNIKKSIENTTSLTVKNIKIFVDHIHFSNE
ncbi:MAG: Asp23/Gls24 family envelope stress response protein [Actinobacteria bacterium]|nr:Asp23/Gls24 family envelope stress response protein [Actinomycetota bacterium]